MIEILSQDSKMYQAMHRYKNGDVLAISRSSWGITLQQVDPIKAQITFVASLNSGEAFFDPHRTFFDTEEATLFGIGLNTTKNG